ncbi:Oxidoreductase family, NAD-binding Rossmann fold [Poriferisphaera corsica]|uniref:Oxidoreductase family, NAD-binding Rossmann fold n=1 Tax=Poriferisphaera corsica TaxID=2528020 RepID=A0A517YWG0_9BACT|nr:Gfo/Idh/MocA family oxidoreductase [Poriferisphaera corsica]QDU34566.1 Oxidoreductase family, NAD-binding Rossmann fold [Poriferisphaera corsica]
MKKIGMIGLDTSHVTIFAELLSNQDHEHYIGGGEVIAGWPGGSKDFAMSHSRVDEYTNALRDQYGATIFETPEEVAEVSDAIFIHAVDGATHLELFKQVVSYGKPVFIDKPLACSVHDAKAIIELAEEREVLIGSASSLRYWDELVIAIADKEMGEIESMEAWGPLSFQEGMPWYFWYGVHSVEMLVAGLGPGCEEMSLHMNDKSEILNMRWADGRSGIYHGIKEGHGGFGAVIHRSEGVQVLDCAKSSRPYYVSLVERLMDTLVQGKEMVAYDEMLETVKILEWGCRMKDEKNSRLTV